MEVYVGRIYVAAIEQYVIEHMKEKLRQLTLFDLRLRQEEEVRAESLVCACAGRPKERLKRSRKDEEDE